MDELEKYYQYLKGAKADVPPTFESFKTTLSDDKTSRQYYQYLRDNKFDTPDNYDSFSNTFGLKKKATSSVSVQPTEVGLPNTPTVEPTQELDPIDASLQADELSKATKGIPVIGGSSFAMGTGSNTVPDEEKINQSKLQKDAVRAKGFDPDVIAEDFKGLDKNELAAAGISTDHILKQYKDNRQLYDRSIASLNSQIALKKELATNPNGNELLHNVIQAFNNEDVGDYSQQRENVKNVIRIADENGGENKDKIVKDIATNFANVYGKQASNITDIEKDPLAQKGLNNLQVAAQNYLEDTNPKEANKYKAALLDDKDIKDNFEAQLQKQEAGRRLEEIGMRLTKSYAQENLNKILPDYTALTNKANTEGLTPEEQMHVQQLEQAGKPFADILKNVSADEASVATRYPKSFYLDANNFAQELVGQKHTGLGWLAAETGRATENTAKGVWDLVSEPFRSEQNSNLHQAEILGGAALSDNSAYLKQNNQIGKNFEPELTPKLQSDVDAIKNDKLLNSDQKIKQVSDLLMNRSGEWRRTSIQGGETNVGLTSLMYGVGGLAANLAPFVAGDLLTGGGANAGALRKFTSTFTSAAATGFHETYINKLRDGAANPFADAARVTAVNSIAMGGADAPGVIRKLAGMETPIGKLVNKMTDVEIESALKESPKALSAFKKSLDVVKGAGKVIGTSALEGAKGGAKMTAFTTGGQVLNDAIDNELKAPADYAKQAAIETLKFTILGTGLGAIGKVMSKPSTMSLAAVSEAGRNPEPFMKALETMERDGSITPESAAQVRTNIDKVSKIFKSSPILKNPDLTESAKREYLYNSIVKNDAQEAAKNLPAKQAEKAEKTAQVSDFKNDLILDPKTDKQLNARQDAIEKILEPKTDANGKSIELPEPERKLLEAEQEAIADVIKSTIEPIQPIITDPTQQGVKEAIPESPDAVGQGDAKAADAISPKINLSLQSQNDNNAELTKQLPNTLSSTEKQGSIAGGETNAAATAITGAIHKAVEDIGTGSKKISPDQVRQKEETELKKYAEDNGIFIKNNFGEPDHFGNEQDVFVNKDGKTVTKINDNPTHDTWNDFFHKIAIHNSLFPDVAYTLKGFSERDGHFAAVLEQPMITKGETPVKFSEVIEELGKMGFEPSTDAKDFSSSEDYKNKQSSNVFVNKNTGVNISDLHGENVIKGTDGKIHFIDPIITIDKNRKIPTEQPQPTPPKADVVGSGVDINNIAFNQKEKIDAFDKIENADTKEPKQIVSEYVKNLTGVNENKEGNLSSQYYDTNKKVNGKDVTFRVSDHTHNDNNNRTDNYLVSVVVNGEMSDGIKIYDDHAQINITANKRNIEERLSDIDDYFDDINNHKFNEQSLPIQPKADVVGSGVVGDVLLKSIDKKDENYDSIEDAVKGKNFVKQTVSIDELVSKDQDLQEYLNDNKETKGRKIEKAIIVGDIARGGETIKGGVIDGFHRIAQAIANGETKIEAYVEQSLPTPPKADVGSEAVVKLEKERDAEIEKVSKPNLSLQLVDETKIPKKGIIEPKLQSRGRETGKKIGEAVVSKEDLIKRQEKIEQSRKRLEDLIDCLTGKKG